jgi:hypothetical protein
VSIKLARFLRCETLVSRVAAICDKRYGPDTPLGAEHTPPETMEKRC